MSYQEYAYTLQPGFLRGPNGREWAHGWANHLDEYKDELIAGVKARFPTEAAAQGDKTALSRKADERRLRRYSGETDAQFGERLKNAWVIHGKSGTEASILADLTGMGFGDVTVMEWHDWPADSTPGVYHSPDGYYDANGNPYWSRVWVFIGSYNGAAIPAGGVLGVMVLGTDRLGIDLDDDLIQAAVTSIKQWKPAHIRLVSVTFLTDDTPMESVLGYGTLGTMILGAGGAGSGSSTVYVNE